MPILNMIAQGSGGGGGGNIGEPLNLTVTTSGLDATIKWEDNEIGTIPPTTFQKSELVRKIGSAPTSPSDGVLVVTETVKDTYKVSGYVDSGLTDGETYYYRVFSYSDLGGISYCDAVNVTPSPGRQPGANTIAYYPLTTSTTGIDQSGNGFNLANGGGVSFGTYQGVDCGYFTGDDCLKTSSGNIINNGSTTFTFIAWMRFIDAGTGNPRIFTGYSQNDGLFLLQNTSGKMVIWNADVTNGITYQTGGWHLYTITGDYSTGSFIGYVDTTSSSWTGNGSTYGVGLCLGGTNSTGIDIFNGYMSNIIFENKIRTAQEVADYYNNTKANYGIS